MKRGKPRGERVENVRIAMDLCGMRGFRPRAAAFGTDTPGAGGRHQCKHEEGAELDATVPQVQRSQENRHPVLTNPAVGDRLEVFTVDVVRVRNLRILHERFDVGGTCVEEPIGDGTWRVCERRGRVRETVLRLELRLPLRRHVVAPPDANAWRRLDETDGENEYAGDACRHTPPCHAY